MSGFSISRREAGIGLMGAMVAPGLARAATPKLFFLGSNKVHTVNTDGTGAKVLLENPADVASIRGLNDGIAYDPVDKLLYWTNMGGANANDGFLCCSAIDGSRAKTIVKPGGTFTPKQMKIDEKGRKLYWSDREGMRLQRCNMDGSNIETIIETGSGDVQRKDQSRWCVGIAIDTARGEVYWTQKGGDNAFTGSIRRCKIAIPKGKTAATRTDVEVLFLNQPEPIDLDLDLAKRQIYWTDRGDNTVNRASMDMPKGAEAMTRKDRVILVRGMKEAIGLTLDLPRNRLYYTSLGGEVGAANLDGSNHKMLLTDMGGLTGIVHVDV